MNTQNTIDILNTLIEAHNNRIEGYETAIKENEEEDLKPIFLEFLQTSRRCKTSLVHEVEKLEGIPFEGTTIAGKLFQFWMDFKYALTCNDRYTLLKSCVEGEGIAFEAYHQVLTNNLEDLSEHLQKILAGHQFLIKVDQEKVTLLYNNSLTHE